MSDRFGLLGVPVPTVADPETSAVGDPMLDVLVSYIQATLNADAGAAWAQIAPAEGLPVQFTFTHNPHQDSFSTNQTPAVYLWRGDDKSKGRYSQGYVSDLGPLNGLWVPPSAAYDILSVRQPFRNAVKKWLKAAFAAGRHPAWVVPGDTYYDPDIYGSVLLKHAGAAQLNIGDFRAYELIIETANAKVKTPYDCLFFTIDVIELLMQDTSKFDPVSSFKGGVTLGQPDALGVVSYDFQLQLLSVSPASAPAAGGTDLVLHGNQFLDDMELVVGGVLVELTLIDESTATATSPPHAAGETTLTLTSPTGESKSLPFTFT